MSDELRVGIVGCGHQGVFLAQAVARTHGLSLVATADPELESARRAAGSGEGVTVHASVEELLAASDVDAVIVATTHDALAPVALAAIRAGRHVLVEKPIALTAEEGRELEYAAASAGVVCMAGYSFRFGMAGEVRRLIDYGTIGEPRTITGSIGVGPLGGWTADPAAGGGPLLYVGCHLVDLALWLFGTDPLGVSGMVHSYTPSGVDETSSVQLEFPGGRLANFTVLHTGFFYELTVTGTAGRVALRGRSLVQYELEVVSEVIPEYREPTTIRPAITGDHITGMLVPELAEFADAIEHGRAPAVTAADGVRVLQILDAIRDATRTGRVSPLSPAVAG